MAVGATQQDLGVTQSVTTYPVVGTPPEGEVLLAQVGGIGFTDGNGGVVTEGQLRSQNAMQLAKEIHAEVDGFRAGRVAFSELQQLKQQGQALLRSGVADPESAASLQRALARIDAQGRSLGDDGGWDVVQMLKDNRALAQQGKLTHAELNAAFHLSEQVQGKHGGHWAAGAGQNVDALQQDLRTRYLPEAQKRERQEIEALEQARQRYEAQPTAQNRQVLQQRRDALNERFNNNGFAPENGEVLQGLLRSANVTLAQPQLRVQSQVQTLEQELGSAVQAYQHQRTPENRKELNDTLAELRSERARAGQTSDTALMRRAGQLLGAPLKGQVRYRDVDPDGGGLLEATYVGHKRGDGSTVQTRVRIKETYDGDRWVASYQAVGVTITDASGKLVSERGGRVYDLKGERGAALASAEQAVERARQLLQAGAISTRDTPRTRTEPGNPVLSPTNDGRFESNGLIIPAGIKGLGNPYVAELRGVLDTQVVPDAQRYLQSGNALIDLRGNDLQNYVGVAMNLAPNVVPVKGGGSQVLYQGEALQAITPVAQAIQKVGGDAPDVRAVPVYLRVGDDKMAKTTIFRVRGDDGRERIVDGDRIYDSFADWKTNNKLDAVDVYVPKDGLLQADGNGKVVFEAFNNRRDDNTALPVIQGGVALLGAGAGVAVILGTGGAAAPIVLAGGAKAVLAGASAFSAANGTLTLVDRNRHGQTLSLSNGEARSAWFDVAGGFLGVGAIGTGNRVVAATSDVVDLITLADGGQRYVRDFNRMSVGERVVAGSQLLFWGAMLGADKVRGGKGRFDFDALTTRMDQGNGGNDYRTVGGNGTPQSPEILVPNNRPQNTPVMPGRGDVTIDVTPQPTPEQVAGERRQQVAAQQFSDPTYQASLRQKLKDVAGDDPGRIDSIVNNPQQLDQLTRPIAHDQLEHRMFAGSGVPELVRTQFLQRAEAWAQQQVQTRGGTVAGHLETLALAGGQTRADLLRPLVAEQMGGGNERLTESVKQQLKGKSEAELKNLLVTKDGQPSQAYVNTVRSALVDRWSDDFKLNPAERGRLEQLVQQRLEGKTPELQRVELVNLANSSATRDALVKQANQTPAQPNVQPGTITSRIEPPVVTERPNVPVLKGTATPPANVPDRQRLTEWVGQLVAAVNNDPNGATVQLLRAGRGLAYAETNVVAKLIDTDAGPVIRVLDSQQQTLLEVPLTANVNAQDSQPTPNVAGMGAREFEAAYLQAYNGTSTGAPNPQEAARLFATWRPAEAQELRRISNETGAPFDALVALRVGGLEITRTEESRSAAPVVEELARSGLVAFNQVRAQEVASGTDAVTTDFLQYVVHNVVAAPGQQDAYTRIADAVEPYLGRPDSEGKSRATFFGSQAPQVVIDEAAGALRGRLPRLYGDKTNEQIIESESLLNREIVVLVGADRNVSFEFGEPRIVEVIPPGGGNLRPDEYRQRLIEFAGALSRQNVTYGGKTTDQIIEENHLADKTLFIMRDARDPNNIATMTASARAYGEIQALSGESFPAGDYLYLGQLTAPQSLPGAGKEKIAALQSMVVNSQHGLGDTPPLEGIALYTNNPTNIGFYLKAGFHLTAVRVDDSGKYGYYFRWHPEHSEGVPIRSYWVESEHGGGEPPPTVNALPRGVPPQEEVALTGESAPKAPPQQQVPQNDPLSTEATNTPRTTTVAPSEQTPEAVSTDTLQNSKDDAAVWLKANSGRPLFGKVKDDNGNVREVAITWVPKPADSDNVLPGVVLPEGLFQVLDLESQRYLNPAESLNDLNLTEVDNNSVSSAEYITKLNEVATSGYVRSATELLGSVYTAQGRDNPAIKRIETGIDQYVSSLPNETRPNHEALKKQLQELAASDPGFARVLADPLVQTSDQLEKFIIRVLDGRFHNQTDWVYAHVCLRSRKEGVSLKYFDLDKSYTNTIGSFLPLRGHHFAAEVHNLYGIGGGAKELTAIGNTANTHSYRLVLFVSAFALVSTAVLGTIFNVISNLRSREQLLTQKEALETQRKAQGTQEQQLELNKRIQTLQTNLSDLSSRQPLPPTMNPTSKQDVKPALTAIDGALSSLRQHEVELTKLLGSIDAEFIKQQEETGSVPTALVNLRTQTTSAIATTQGQIAALTEQRTRLGLQLEQIELSSKQYELSRKASLIESNVAGLPPISVPPTVSVNNATVAETALAQLSQTEKSLTQRKEELTNYLRQVEGLINEAQQAGVEVPTQIVILRDGIARDLQSVVTGLTNITSERTRIVTAAEQLEVSKAAGEFNVWQSNRSAWNSANSWQRAYGQEVTVGGVQTVLTASTVPMVNGFVVPLMRAGYTAVQDADWSISQLEAQGAFNPPPASGLKQISEDERRSLRAQLVELYSAFKPEQSRP